MDIDLDAKRNIEFTVSECVFIRNALRLYAEDLMRNISDALDCNSFASAKVHEVTLSEIIEAFGKLL